MNQKLDRIITLLEKGEDFRK
ncbi:hypothetical protein [Salibacterium halotolerans]